MQDVTQYTNLPFSEIEVLSPTLAEAEQADAIKEPEEPEHKAECPLSQAEEASQPGEEAPEEDEEKWTLVLGHDKLKKRVGPHVHL